MASYSVVEILSETMIKPSSPTPPNLRNLKLSVLDKSVPPFGVPLILFYKRSDHISQLKLKQSLSHVLTRFYPLAGKIVIHPDNSAIIDCNDDGVLYIEARVSTDLMTVLDAKDMEELIQYCPPSEPGQIARSILALQVTEFKCGGISIGIRISHTVSDAMSMLNFLTAWATNCRGNNQVNVITPSFGFDSLFPAIDLASCGIYPESLIITEKLVTKLVVFEKETLFALKKLAGLQVKDSTRVEVVSSFIWNRFIQAAGKRPVAAVVTVNIRRRMDPALPDSTFGNIWRATLAKPSLEGDDLVSELRNVIRSVDSRDDHVNKQVDVLREYGEVLCCKDMDACVVTSWCRFGVYEVDFGWGKPNWACPAAIPMNNFVVLMDSADGEGVEAWINEKA